nr:uncharacterized protein C12orf73 homolog isoform X1 [Pogona vitticeps]
MNLVGQEVSPEVEPVWHSTILSLRCLRDPGGAELSRDRGTLSSPAPYWLPAIAFVLGCLVQSGVPVKVSGQLPQGESIPEIPPKPGELRTELLGLKERSQKAQP